MKRSPLRRSRTAIARTPVKKVNRARKNREWLRAYGSKERVQWVQAQPCCVTAYYAIHRDLIDNVHIETGGTGRKADADSVVAMCRDHHRFLHTVGRETFEKSYGLKLADDARKLKKRWLEFSARGAQEQDA